MYHEYVFDIGAGDSGAVGVVDLSAKAEQANLPVGAVKKKVTGYVKTAFVGGGASLQWGRTGDTDEDKTVEAVGALTVNSVHPPDAENFPVTDANTGSIVVEVTGAPFTEGAIGLMVEYYFPK